MGIGRPRCKIGGAYAMTLAMPLAVSHLYRYPVKGLSPDPLARVELRPGEGLPHDRRYAIAHGATVFDPAAPEWLPKTHFLMLMKNERLARLKTRYDEASETLTIERDGKVVARGQLLDPTGRVVIEQFFAAFMAGEIRGRPKVVSAPAHMFSDTNRKVISIIGLASIRDLERVMRVPVDPRRFRANVYFDGGRAWEEMRWKGGEIAIGGARLKVLDAIDRCAATNVDPETGARDLNVPRALEDGFRHIEMGVYAEVIAGGAIQVGDEIRA